MFEERSSGRPKFDLPNVAYYFGALVVISAMTWFMTLGWERFGGGGIMVISLIYALVFVAAGALLWRARDLRVPGGLLVTAAVCMTPLAVYGFERKTGLWLQETPGQYQDFYVAIISAVLALSTTVTACGYRSAERNLARDEAISGVLVVGGPVAIFLTITLSCGVTSCGP